MSTYSKKEKKNFIEQIKSCSFNSHTEIRNEFTFLEEEGSGLSKSFNVSLFNDLTFCGLYMHEPWYTLYSICEWQHEACHSG